MTGLVERLLDDSDDPYFTLTPGVQEWLKRNWALREEAAAALSALPAAQVKGLEWEQPGGPEGTAWLGHGIDPCEYYIRFDSETASYWMPGESTCEDIEEYLALEDAKAAAQADFEKRILSALSAPAMPDPTKEENDGLEHCGNYSATDPITDEDRIDYWKGAYERMAARNSELCRAGEDILGHKCQFFPDKAWEHFEEMLATGGMTR